MADPFIQAKIRHRLLSKCSQVLPKTLKNVAVQQTPFRQLIGFPRLSGAPGETRIPDPLLRSRSNYFAKSRQRSG